VSLIIYIINQQVTVVRIDVILFKLWNYICDHTK